MGDRKFDKPDIKIDETQRPVHESIERAIDLRVMLRDGWFHRSYAGCIFEHMVEMLTCKMAEYVVTKTVDKYKFCKMK